MKQFLIGLIIGSLCFGGIAFYVYNSSQQEIKSATTKIVSLEKAKETKTMTVEPSQDVGSLAAQLLNARLDVLAEAKGTDFDRQYIAILNTSNSELETLATEAKKRANDSTVRSVAEKVAADSRARSVEIYPLRSLLGLID